MAINFELNTEITDPQKLLDEFFKTFPSYSINIDKKKLIEDSWQFLIDKSKNYERDKGTQFHLHPMRIAAILARNNLDTETIVASFLHNILSLPNVEEEELKSKFNKSIFRIIKGTTKLKSLKIQNKTLQEADNIKKMLFAMVDDIRIILVKLADRLDRLRNIAFIAPEEQKSIANEAIDIWAPLAGRLGMSNIKSEFEDLSLKFTNPDVFQYLKKIVDMKKIERATYLDKAQKEIYKAATRAGIEVTVNSRAKHFYSIYKKMKKRNKPTEELFDLLAIRIICKTDAECYTTVGLVHNLWKPLEGRFKDYIAMPKANGYQSLHTTVQCDGKPLEIQIRTEQMHNVAEYGIASHWLYKKGMTNDIVNIDNLSIINQLKELKENHLADTNFFNEIKNELLGDSIFVFTPQGDVKELPKGATAIDFAYQIHSHIGEKIIGAKANGKIIPLSSPLKNTQIIEILTSTKAHPTTNQLQIAKTAKARSKIRSWLLQNMPEKIAEKEKEDRLKAEKLTLRSSQSHRSGKDEIEKQHRTSTTNNFDSVKIRIGDTNNFLITIARCCSPVVGDEIVGYVSRGRGIIVHKANCRNFSRIANISERTINVIWDKTH